MPNIATQRLTWTWVVLGVLFIGLTLVYNVRDAAILAGLTLMWLSFSFSLNKLEKVIYFLIPASFACYQFYILDLNRDTPNIGVVWFLVLVGWATLSGGKLPVVFWSAVAMLAIALTCYRAPPDDPLWSHPLSLPNILGVLCALTLTCLWLQWTRQQRESALARYIQKTERLSRELQQANARLRVSEARKSNLLSTMSHELRTPMMTIAAVAQDLSRRFAGTEDHGTVRSMLRSAENMTDLMSDILDLEAVRTGQASVAHQEFELMDVAEDACNLALESVGESVLVIDISPDLPVRYCGDPGRLKQIMLNLLRNAMRHSRSREVSLRLRSYSDERLRFSVVDTGVGMALDQAERIFEPFVQGKDNGGGSGLGLPISRAFAELLGGKITVDSILGEGTSFDVEVKMTAVTPDRFGDVIERPKLDKVSLAGLPVLLKSALQRWLVYWDIATGEDGVDLGLNEATLHPISVKMLDADAAKDKQMISEAGSLELFSGVRLAIIEDDALLRSLLSKFFATIKREVYCTGDAQEGWRILDREKPDVVIMDLNIPHTEDGLALLRKAVKLHPRPLIVVLSGQPETMSACLNIGADLFLAKPVRMATLRDSIAAHLGERVA